VSGLFRPAVAGLARHLRDLISRPEYRSASLLETRLGRLPRHQECKARVHGWVLRIPDAASFLGTYRELFVDETLAFEWEGSEPRILDLGANIGLSVLYYKRRYPGARVVAFEADPAICRFLVENVHGNGFADVEVVNKAAWDKTGRLRFSPDGADGGAVRADGGAVRAGAAAAGDIEVDACDLAAYLEGRVFDVVKMDIEGAEARVLRAIAPHLRSVRHLFVEYHSRVGESQELADVLRLMAEAGFRVHVRSVWSSRSPLLRLESQSGFDMQLFLFGRRR